MRIKRINLAVQNNQPMPPFTYILPAAIAICWSVCIFCRKDTGKIQTVLAASMLTACKLYFSVRKESSLVSGSVKGSLSERIVKMGLSDIHSFNSADSICNRRHHKDIFLPSSCRNIHLGLDMHPPLQQTHGGILRCQRRDVSRQPRPGAAFQLLSL